MASKKVIVSAEEIIEPMRSASSPSARRFPTTLSTLLFTRPSARTRAARQGLYGADLEQWLAFAAARREGKIDEYLENWVYSVASHQEMLDKRVGAAKLQALRDADTLKEGYYD